MDLHPSTRKAIIFKTKYDRKITGYVCIGTGLLTIYIWIDVGVYVLSLNDIYDDEFKIGIGTWLMLIGGILNIVGGLAGIGDFEDKKNVKYID